MAVLSFEDFLGYSLKTFNIFGWKSMKEDKWLTWHSLYFWISFCGILICLFLTSLFVIVNIGNEETLAYQTHDLASIAIICLIASKTFCLLFYNHSKCKKLLLRLKELFPTTEEDQKKFGVESEARVLRIKNGVFIYIYFSNSLMFNVMPVWQSLFRYYFGDGVYKLNMPYHFWYPFEHDRNFIRELCYVFICWCNVTNCTMVFTTDLLYISILTSVKLQFKFLKTKFEEFNLQRPEKEIHEEIALLVDKHNELIRLSEEVESIFTAPTFANFVSSTWILCCVSFQLFVSYEIS